MNKNKKRVYGERHVIICLKGKKFRMHDFSHMMLIFILCNAMFILKSMVLITDTFAYDNAELQSETSGTLFSVARNIIQYPSEQRYASNKTHFLCIMYL